MDDVRANPWVLDYIFASLLEDDLTKKVYGKKSVETMKRWIAKTDIPVFVNTRLDSARIPCVTINLIESQETDNTHGDVHHDPTMEDSSSWPALTRPFNPIKWTSSTGELVLPPEINEQTYVFPEMNVQDRNGQLHSILEVYEDDEQRTVAVLAEGTIADFTGSVLKSKSAPTLIHLESAMFRETYLIGCHVNGESFQLTALHSFVTFVLLRYREAYLEARGFEVSSFSSTDFSKNQAFDPEQVWSRYLSLTGKVRNVWPKARVGRVQGVDMALRITDADLLPPDTDPNDALWIGDQDALTVRMKR